MQLVTGASAKLIFDLPFHASIAGFTAHAIAADTRTKNRAPSSLVNCVHSFEAML